MNQSIDFNQIRGDLPGGQRAAFEELICQLARRQPHILNSFRRIEGAGGDGGVECMHRLPTGGISGYQAKYHTRPTDIDWRAIDKSVSTALTMYPDLVTYTIAVACTFTGRRRVKGGGTSDGTWGEWDAHVEKWQSEIAKSGRAIEFVPWTESEIFDQLTAPSSAGLRKYWFDASEFSATWFTEQTKLACAALDERYSPADHVDVEIQALFDIITRHPHSCACLHERFTAIRKSSFPEDHLPASASQPPAGLLAHSVNARQALLACEPEIEASPWEPWAVEQWTHLAHAASANLSELANWAWNAKSLKESEDEQNRNALDSFYRNLNGIRAELSQLDTLLARPYFKAERIRTALIEGRAGTGKSHLLAHVAEVALSENRPVILVLGQQLRNQPLWPQILQRLGLTNISPDAFLGSLDAFAESVGVRGLILVDAINEGPGAHLWRHELASFLEQLRPYTNLACVISCRSEYVDYVIPSLVLESLPRFPIRGFETTEEEARAARVYLDKRGIARPATPWLTPEFTNPLFLRSCCNALNREGKTEFPRGLTGTKAIFAFFINSVSRHLGVGRDGSDDLVSPTKSTLRELAIAMARMQRDYVARDQAEAIALRNFQNFPAPTVITWLEILQRNGLLRFDPDPRFDPTDPLYAPSDIVRFSFQRFQDHLMAEALLAEVSDLKTAFADGGQLSFIREETSIRREWQGLIEALSIQLPERFQTELADALPGDAIIWWSAWQIPDAFAESIRWRAYNAFTARTLELFNPPFGPHQSQWSLLIELSVLVNHPWNAERIHHNLVSKTMPERDAFWTTAINAANDEEAHPLYRLLDWALRGPSAVVTFETQRLCALLLTWCFTSTSRLLRDRATKALTTVLLSQPTIFPQLLNAFEGVDDLYIWERLFAAAYAACCLDPRPERLSNYAALMFKQFFSQKVPPANLLLRDYARGIIELANHSGVCPSNVDLACCRPPYASSLPDLSVTETELYQLADQAGDRTIVHSCCGPFGDFGHYDIEPATRGFVTIPLSDPPPYSAREQFDRFQAEVIGDDKDRQAALEQLHTLRFAHLHELTLTLVEDESTESEILAQPAVEQWVAELQAAEATLLMLLNRSERERYLSEAFPWLEMNNIHKASEPQPIDVGAARRWVAKRAYDLGWTKHRFPGDVRQYLDGSRSRPSLERIGKKYQWLAQSELLCRLADNLWLGGPHAWHTKRYDTPIDIGFRDIDPTVLPQLDQGERSQAKNNAWILGPEIPTPESTDIELEKWPFSADPSRALQNLISVVDPQGNRWLTLYNSRRVLAHHEHPSTEHQLRQEEFRLLYCVLVHRTDTAQIVAHLKRECKIDVNDWSPPRLIDSPYLLEAPWRITWPQQQWHWDKWRINQVAPVAFPVYEYLWESHLDASLPKEARAFIPAPWLSSHLGLSPDGKDGSIYRNAAGERQFIGTKQETDDSSALIDAALFSAYLDKHVLDCLWLLVAERSAWPGKRGDSRTQWRSEGICWLEGGKPITATWHEDHVVT